MSKIIKRTTDMPLWKVLENFHRQKDDWRKTKAVCVFRGLAGCGKTTYLLHYFKDKKTFYFSFLGLEEELAERLFAERVADKTDIVVSGWTDAIQALSAKYRVILFDDVASISSYKRFHKAFYDNMMTDIKTRPFVVLIAQPNDDVTGLADAYARTDLSYFSIPEVMKLYPALSKHDILGLCTISGGIPAIMHEYDSQFNVEDNLRKLLEPDSAFVRLMPELLARYFRKPDNYHRILHAIANGSHSVSDIGKYTDFAYNKCDNYLAGLVSCGFVAAKKVESKRGAKKTAYMLTNNYFLMWYKYIFTNHTEVQLGNRGLAETIIQSIVDHEVHAFHLQKAFALANSRIRSISMWSSFGISGEIIYAPETVSDRKFRYTFDAICRNDDRAVFIKIFEDPMENCGRDELEKIRRAVTLVNAYYDSHVYIFSKRRFSDYAVAEAANDQTISLVEVDRLRV